MDYAFRRRRKSKISLDTNSLESVLIGLSIDESTAFDDDDTFGPLGLNTLFSPSQPLVDIVFVHGLQGGSRKTWSSSKKIHHFWPKEWLSRDPGFQHARVHSFGYRSDWINIKSSILNINHIAETLLASIQHSPSMGEPQQSKIIFVAHSMGGLVVKKAFIEAHGSAHYNNIADRIDSIFFLGTPHKGSESARSAELLVALSPFHGDKPYVKDLRPTSVMIQSINSDFPKYSKRLQLFSFYETLETWAGTSKMIVSRDSAVMGYENEKRISMNKNHRGVCKFDSPTDPDFMLLRNSLCRMVDRIVQDVSDTQRTQDLQIAHDLQEYLDVRDKPEDDLLELEEIALPGSASWYLQKPQFREWRDGPPHSSSLSPSPGYLESLKIMWVNAMPGGGKSILASQVVGHLESLNMDCCYYFFTLQEQSKSTASGLLRSLAYQMALLSPTVRQKLLQLKESGVQCDSMKEKLIWRKIFVGGIFTCQLDRPQLWVIDALDECHDYDTFLTMLNKVESAFPVRIFLTSRPLPQIKNKMDGLGSRVWEHHFNVNDIQHNIKRFVADGPHSHILHYVAPERRRDLAQEILEKSEGCFLWVQLVMERLEHTKSTEDIERILNSIPPGMDKLYTRILAEIVEADEGATKVTEAILSTVVCAMHPLTVAELVNAIKIQLNITILEHSIRSSCGSLIYIDKTGRVCLVHQTARDYLLKHGLFDTFKTNSTNAHHSLAMVCLEYLKGTQVPPLRMLTSPGSSALRIKRRLETSPFAQYACTHFSDHVRRSRSDDDELLDSIYKFLTTNGLSWIEHIAASDRLSVLVQASQNLRGFLQVRAKHKPPIGLKSRCIEQWSIDLIRIVVKFGKHLLRLPQSIYGLIAPLAPRQSAIFAQFDRRKGIDIVGISNESWDDRLCGISFQGRTATAIACGESTFAVGLRDGSIFVYDHATFQELNVFQHQEAVKILQYSSNGHLLISASMRYAKLWNVTEGVKVWDEKTTVEPLAIAFANYDQKIIAITRSNHLVERNTADGKIIKTTVRPYPHKSERDFSLFPGGDLKCANLDVASNMLATSHRGYPVILSELDTNEEIGQCEPEADPTTPDYDRIEPAVAVEFCPNTEVNLVAVVYRDGGLAVFDPTAQGALIDTVHDFEVQRLACSPDGRTLAVSDSSGAILLYETETLKLLYRIIHRSNLAIRALAFSANSGRLIDIRESQCNIWEPPILMRIEPQETESVSDMLSTSDDSFGPEEDVVEITAIAATASGDFVICGTDHGSVVLHSANTGQKLQQLYEHATRSWISSIDISARAIASIGGTNQLIVKKYRTDGGWKCDDSLDVHYSERMCQILFNKEGSRLLVAFDTSVIQYDVESGSVCGKVQSASAGTWALHPLLENRVFAVRPDGISQYEWEYLDTDKIVEEMDIAPVDATALKVQCVAPTGRRTELSAILSSAGKRAANAPTFSVLLDISSPARTSLKPVTLSTPTGVEHIAGIQGGKLYFLDKDLWLCSISLDAGKGTCSHHMFVPDEWLKANNRPLLLFTSKNELVLAKMDELVIVKRPLTYTTTLPATLSK